MKFFIGVDEGTTGCKAVLFNSHGEMIAVSAREYPSYYPNPGWVEQDIEEIKEAVFSCCADVMEEASKRGIAADEVIGISHSNQGITMVLLDENEEQVLSHSIGWQDLRYVEILPGLKENIDLDSYWEKTGMKFGTYNIPVLCWIQQKQPDEWKRVHRICSHQDYFLRQYGADEYYIDEGSANFLSMVNRKTNEWDEEIMSLFGVSKYMLPTIVHKPGKVVGNVSASFSKRTGIPTTCKVVLGGLDTNCCAFGAGASETGTQILIMGTAGVSILITDNNTLDPNGRITIRSNPGFNNYQNYIMTNTGASAFRWFRDSLCSMEVATSELMGEDPYNLITRIAARSQIGANGVIGLTCIQGAHGRYKNEYARGTFFGINLGTTKADLAEAILEGICYEMKDILSMNEKLSGKVKRIRLCGG